MVVIEACEGGEIEAIEGGIVIRGVENKTMRISKLVRPGGKDCF